MKLSKLAIISGHGDLPLEIYEVYKQSGGQAFIISLVERQDKFFQEKAKFFSIGQVGKIIDYLNKNNIKDIVIVGAIERPKLNNIKVDFTGSILMTSLLTKKMLGDDSILSNVASFIEKRGFNILSPIDLLQNYQTNFYTKVQPTKEQYKRY